MHINNPSDDTAPPPAPPEGAAEMLKEAARQAGDCLVRHRGNLKHIELKSSDIDLVTEADKAAEAIVISLIRENYPDHGILAEESGELSGEGRGDSPWQWVIDPLDGTTNFAHGLPIFCVSIALHHQDGGAVLGGVNAPALDEFYFAQTSEGALLNGDPIRVSTADTLKRALVVTGFPYDRIERVDHYMSMYGEMLKRTRGVLRWGSAALDLCQVAAGRLECFWEEKLNPWDTAAGELIVREAGGRVTRFNGGPYTIFTPEILATNGRLHDKITGVLQPYGLDENAPSGPA